MNFGAWLTRRRDLDCGVGRPSAARAAKGRRLGLDLIPRHQEDDAPLIIAALVIGSLGFTSPTFKRRLTP